MNLDTINNFFLRLRNKKILHPLLVIIACLIIVGWGYILRLDQFTNFPPLYDTADELKDVFNGINLIKYHVPESWSWYSDYGKLPNIWIKNHIFRLVKPFFDDPPLFGLMIGAYSINKGMDSYDKIDIRFLRPPMLFIGAMNIVLLFLLVYFLSGILPAILASFIYAVGPSFVMSSRLVLVENLIITLMLITLLMVFWYLKSNSKLVLLLLSAISGLLILLKATTIYIPMSIIFIFIAKKKYKSLIPIILGVLMGIGLWFGYGYFYNPPLFFNLLGKFNGRNLWQPNVIINLFTTFSISEKPIKIDILIIWGWISAIIFGLKQTKVNNKLNHSWLFFISTLGCYLVMFAVMSGQNKGWYRFPIYPLLSWAIAEVFLYYLYVPNFIYTLFFISLPVSYSYITAQGMREWSVIGRYGYQILFPLIILIPLLSALLDNRWLKICHQILLTIMVLLIIIWGSQTVLFHSKEFWYQ